MNQAHKKVRSLYEKYPYPTPEDRISRVKNGTFIERGYPNLFFHNIWPYRKYSGKLDILIAGCGSMHAVEYAAANPEANVIGIDLSHQSLEHTNMLMDKHGVTNLALHKLPLENISTLNKKFDLIVSTGVIHHLPNPETGLKALNKALKKDGSMYLMLYGKYGRDAIYYVQELMCALGLSVENLTEDTLDIVYEILQSLPPYHPIHARSHIFSDLCNKDKKAEMIDYFLHPQDKAYSMPEIYKLLDSSGLKMQKLLNQADYLPECHSFSRTSYFEEIKKFPIERQIEIGELHGASYPKHNFYACSKERKENTYKIDFTSPGWKELIPIISYGVEISNSQNGKKITSPHHVTGLQTCLDPVGSVIFERIDGKRSIQGIESTFDLQDSQEKTDSFLKDLFKKLMDYDYIYFNASRT